MADAPRPRIYSIAAHRGFADALVAGLAARHRDPELGFARMTLLVPSSRAARTVSENFIRHAGEAAEGDATDTGLLMPRMVTIGDLDLDEALGALLDPLGTEDIPVAVEPTQRWLVLARLIDEERASLGEPALPGASRLRLARDLSRTMDRLLVEQKTPADLLSEAVLDRLGNLASHWQRSLRLFARVQARWVSWTDERGVVDAATRRNLLFDRAARRWREDPPQVPIIAAGITSAAPALARLLKVVAALPQGAVVLPDLELEDAAWAELGQAGAAPQAGADPFSAQEALTHPQYHLKLLLERMGIARREVRPWHRKGMTASPPERSHAIRSLFLPPEASKSWVDLPAEKRRLSGVRLMESATAEGEAQAIALMVREALEVPLRRIAVISADRSLARRVSQALARWNIIADDTSGEKLSVTPAGRLLGLLAEIASHGAEPVTLIGLVAHPLVRAGDGEARRAWLQSVRAFDRRLRRDQPGSALSSLRGCARLAGVGDWWEDVERIIAPLVEPTEAIALAQAMDMLVEAASQLAGEAAWAREDGRALSRMVEDVRLHARALDTTVAPADLAAILRDTMDEIAVRPPYGGHPRVGIYGLLESRMVRADLVICGGLNEGSWPQPPGADALLAPDVLRALGIPAAEFRIGLAAHDLASAMGAPEVVLSRAQRDADGPTLPSRFLLRVEALLGELADKHRETRIPAMLPALDRAPPREPDYPRPAPRPAAHLRDVEISATALDRLLGDPFQFYAREILGLKRLDPLNADPFGDPALRGTLVHDILDGWHKARVSDPALRLVPFAQEHLHEAGVHPLFKGLWQPRILAALERFEAWIGSAAAEGRTVLATEIDGAMNVRGVKVRGRADRIDQLADGRFAIVDYKTGKPPSAAQVEAGFALQMGVLGLILRDGGFASGEMLISGNAGTFEYWSLGKKDGEFGFFEEPMKVGNKRSGLTPEEFLPRHSDFLDDAITRFIKGDAPFTARENPDYPGYSDYDQLMRLEEWIIRLSERPAPQTGAVE